MNMNKKSTKGTIYSSLIKFFFEPKNALILFALFLIIALVFLDTENAFQQKFLAFGPAKNPADQSNFLQMKLNTWPKVLIVYAIAFLSSIMDRYYDTVSFDFIHMYAWNPLIKTMNYSKFWTYNVVLIEPILFVILNTIKIFILITQQLQFILIQFLGSSLITVPYALYRLSQKKFTRP